MTTSSATTDIETSPAPSFDPLTKVASTSYLSTTSSSTSESLTDISKQLRDLMAEYKGFKFSKIYQNYFHSE